MTKNRPKGNLTELSIRNSNKTNNLHEEVLPHPVEGDVSNLAQGTSVSLSQRLDGSVLNKLPKIDYFVQQGHFGYEHGRNGKGSSKQVEDDSESHKGKLVRWAVNTRHRNQLDFIHFKNVRVNQTL